MNKSMLKKAAIFGLAGVMAVAAGCGSNKDAGNANNNEAKIALLTTTTGGAAAYGESIKLVQNWLLAKSMQTLTM